MRAFRNTLWFAAVLAATGASAGVGRADNAATAASTLGALGAAVGAQRILVIPFSTINVGESQQWISKGVQETLLVDLGRSRQYSAIAFQGQVIVEDNATAARLARQASATLVVRGAVQVIGPNARLTAQLIDAQSGDTLNTASATGPVADLLRLEDEVSAELRGSSPASVSPAVPAAPPVALVSNGTTAGATPFTTQTPQVIVINTPASGGTAGAYPSYANYPVYTPVYSNYAYYPYVPFTYTYSYIGWPYVGGVIYVNGGHRGGRDRDHDRDDHRPPPPRGSTGLTFTRTGNNTGTFLNSVIAPMPNVGAAPMPNPGAAPMPRPAAMVGGTARLVSAPASKPVPARVGTNKPGR